MCLTKSDPLPKWLEIYLIRDAKKFWGIKDAAVAQLAEQRTCNAKVEGSIPFGSNRINYDS